MLAIAVALLILGVTTHKLTPLKSVLMDVSTPLYYLSDMPTAIARWFNRMVTPSSALRFENNQLKAEALVLKGKLQQLNALSMENIRLRELLNATPKVPGRVLLTEVIAVSPTPMHHYVIINKGKDHGVYEGQSVIDQQGLFGQVVEVARESARVLLISDEHHAVPAEVSRNGLRVVAEGTNHFFKLNLPNIAPTSDIQEGDVLISSGLGGVFPRGYPVAKVTKISLEKGDDYLTVQARPFAMLNYSRHLLLLFNSAVVATP